MGKKMCLDKIQVIVNSSIRRNW